MSSPALAQDDESVADTLEPEDAADGVPGVEVIFITARKREERLIDAPVAATALNQMALERYKIGAFQQLTTALPGVNIYRASGGGGGGNFEIRGIGRVGSDYGQEQAVSLVIDGFSFTRGHATNIALFDVASIEVLKGPQTLFFGKNSPAGVISVKTVSPGDVFEGFARASYEFRTEDPIVELGVSVPIIREKLAIRVAGKGEFMQGGYLDFSTDPNAVRDLSPFETDALYPSVGPHADEFPEQRTYVGRLTAVFTPTESFDATFKFTWSKEEQNDAGSNILWACADGGGSHPHLNTVFFGLVEDTGQTCPGRFGNVKLERPTAVPPRAIYEANPTLGGRSNRYFQRTRNILATLEMNWQIGDVTLTSVSGFWDYNQDEYTNYDYTSFAVVSSLQGESGDSWTTELRMQTNFDAPVNFMLGGFYEDMQRDLDAPVQIFPLGPAPSGTGLWPAKYDGSFLTYHHFWDNWIESYSIFGELVWDITDTLEFSGGVRYSDEDRDTKGHQLFSRLEQFFPSIGLPVGDIPFAPNGSKAETGREFDDVSPSATLSWHPLEDLMVYAAYKTGYQAAGTSNPGTFGNFFTCPSCPLTEEEINDALTFDGTDVEGFELGIKGQFLDGRLRAELIGWWYDFTDLQVSIFNSDTTTFTIQNAAAAINQGIEGSFTYLPFDELELRGSFQYVDLEYEDYENAQCYAGQNDPTASNYRPELAAHCAFDPRVGDFVQDMSGKKYGNGPFQFKLGFTWERPLGYGEWIFSFSGDVIYKEKGKKFLRQPQTSVPSFTVFDLAARVHQGPWELALICSNCGNEKYVVSILDKPLQKIGDLTGQVAFPRLITVEATYRW